jgi:hypothetical protein
VARSHHLLLSDGADLAALDALLGAMAAQAEDLVAKGAPGAAQSERRVALGRYAGQGFEIPFDLPAGPLARRGGTARFVRSGLSHARQPGARPAGGTPDLPRRRGGAGVAGQGASAPLADRWITPTAWRDVIDPQDGLALRFAVVAREDMAPGDAVRGPVLVTERETTTVVSPRFDARMDANRTLVCTRRPEEPAHEQCPVAAPPGDLDPLIAIVEEQAQTLMRTAFSTTVRDAGDLSAALFDLEGRLIAEAVTGTPGHVNSMAAGVRHFIDRFPLDTMEPGDHFITNDPWLTAGHLHDVTVVSPAFHQGRIVGLFGVCCHQVDIGGLGQGPDGRSIYEEGIQIPLMKLASRGELNEQLLEIVCQNVRTPLQVRGDILSYVTSNNAAIRRLAAMLGEFGMDDLQDVADTIVTQSLEATRAEIARLPQGSWSSSLTIDGYDTPVTLRATLTIDGEREGGLCGIGRLPAARDQRGAQLCPRLYRLCAALRDQPGSAQQPRRAAAL